MLADTILVTGFLFGMFKLGELVGEYLKSRRAAKKEIDPTVGQSPEWQTAYYDALDDLDEEFPSALVRPHRTKSLSGSYNKVLTPGLYGLFKDQQNVYQQQRESFEQQLMQVQPGQLFQLENQQQLGNISRSGLAGQQDLTYLLGVKRKGEPN